MKKNVSFKEKQKQNSEYVKRFRIALHWELQHQYDEAMIAWAMAEIVAPSLVEANKAKNRKEACLKLANKKVERLMDQSTSELVDKTIKV